MKFAKVFTQKFPATGYYVQHNTQSIITFILSAAYCNPYRLREGESEVEVNPMSVFHSAVANAKPCIGTTRVTRGGKHYHVRLSLTHHTCTQTHTHALTHTHTHTHTHHTYTYAHTHTHTHSQSHSHSHSHSHTHLHSHSLTLTLTHTHACTHTWTHTYMYTNHLSLCVHYPSMTCHLKRVVYADQRVV